LSVLCPGLALQSPWGKHCRLSMESLILAQDERWRRA
jgi:hypothetical protein